MALGPYPVWAAYYVTFPSARHSITKLALLQVVDIHLLMVIAVGGAITLGDYTEAATVVVLFSLADWLEGRCSLQASYLSSGSLFLPAARIPLQCRPRA